MKVNLGEFYATPEQKKVVNEIIESGRITEGKYTKLFEEQWAAHIGTKHAIACTNGTVGLMLVLQALKLLYEKTFKFAVPATTFPATLNAVTLTNHLSYLCDVGADLLINIDESAIVEKKIDGIIPVHLMGYPCNMDKMMYLQKKYGLFILEDCCEATGSSFKGQKVGSFGNAGVFSFYVSHPIGIGELGAITTNSDELASMIRKIKNHGRGGSNLEFRHDFVGYNFKTTEFMAALAYYQMRDIEFITEKRRENVLYLNERLRNKDLKPFRFDNETSYLGYPLMATSKQYKAIMLEKLHKAGVETRDMFPCLANQKAYRLMLLPEEVQKILPMSVYIEDTCFYLPCHQYLKKEDLDLMLSVLNDG